jgi:hypothetical protein
MIRKKKANFFNVAVNSGEKKNCLAVFFKARPRLRQIFKVMKNSFYYTSIYCVQTIRFLGGVIGATFFFIYKKIEKRKIENVTNFHFS